MSIWNALRMAYRCFRFLRTSETLYYGYFKDNCVDFGLLLARDRHVAKLQRIVECGALHAMALPVAEPGGCGRCKRAFGEPRHCTEYYDKTSCYPLCEYCWKSLSVEQRLPYYRALWIETGGMAKSRWEDLERAVMEGL